MMRWMRFGLMSLLVCAASLFAILPVHAIPVLPSSFYGTVKINGQNVADGTKIRGVINGKAYAEGFTQTYQGNSVFSLDVPGDDAGTSQLEGGKEGDAVRFMVGGIEASQVGTWHSGTNVKLNLTVSTGSTPIPPQPTPTPLPTQTAIEITIQPSPTPTSVPPTIPAATIAPAATDTAAAPALPSQAAQPGNSMAVAAGAASPRETRPNGNTAGVAAIVIGIAAAAGIWLVTRRK